MVVYEYLCEDCETVWEVFYRSIPENSEDPVTCDTCGKDCNRCYFTPPNVKTSMPWEGTGRSAADYIKSYDRELVDQKLKITRDIQDVDKLVDAQARSPYKNYQLTKEGLESAGRIKPLTPEKKEAKRKAMELAGKDLANRKPKKVYGDKEKK